MNQPTRAPQPDRVGGNASDAAPRVIDSATLMDGRRELVIRHSAETYRLRVTASNKLIFTK